MNTTLKTLLITSVLSTASIFGASAAPSGDFEFETGSRQSSDLGNREVERLSGGELAKKYQSLSSLPFELIVTIAEMVGETEDLSKVSKKITRATNYAMRERFKRSVFRMPTPLLTHGLMLAIEDVFKNSLAPLVEPETPHSMAYTGMSFFKIIELFAKSLNLNIHNELLITFRNFVEDCNIPQLQIKDSNIFRFQRVDAIRIKAPRACADDGDIVKTVVSAVQQNDSETLLKYATDGVQMAQKYVAWGYALHEYGFNQNPTELLDLAKRGWLDAQHLVIEGYANGLYQFAQNPEEIKRRAHIDGWPAAQKFVADGYAKNWYGFTKSLAELERLGKDGWVIAQQIAVDIYAHGKHGFNQNPKKLVKVAKLGWPMATQYVIDGYARGMYGIAPNPKKLVKVAKLGLPEATQYVIDGYANGSYGIAQEPKKLMKLAHMGWPKAQEYLVKGYAQGMYGFSYDSTLSRLFQSYFNLKNKGHL